MCCTGHVVTQQNPGLLADDDDGGKTTRAVIKMVGIISAAIAAGRQRGRYFLDLALALTYCLNPIVAGRSTRTGVSGHRDDGAGQATARHYQRGRTHDTQRRAAIWSAGGTVDLVQLDDP